MAGIESLMMAKTEPDTYSSGRVVRGGSGGHNKAQYRLIELGRSGGTWMNTLSFNS